VLRISEYNAITGAQIRSYLVGGEGVDAALRERNIALNQDLVGIVDTTVCSVRQLYTRCRHRGSCALTTDRSHPPNRHRFKSVAHPRAISINSASPVGDVGVQLNGPFTVTRRQYIRCT